MSELPGLSITTLPAPLLKRSRGARKKGSRKVRKPRVQGPAGVRRGPDEGRKPRARRPLVLAGLLVLAVAAFAVVKGRGGTRPGSEREAASPPGKIQEIPELTVEVLASHPHDPGAFTQGLLWFEGHLYESTGLNGRSSLRRSVLATGQVLEIRDLPRELFGEGLARVGDQLYQLTWLSGLGQIWDVETFERTGQFFYEGQGWGLCYDGRHLILSNGTPVLSFRDPSTFAEVHRRTVQAAGRRVRNLNELECVDGEIYANILSSDRIARIDGESGEVTAWIDASGLLEDGERSGADVLNGIAYQPERGVFLLTGKLWPKIFEVRFIEPAGRARKGDPQETAS